MVETCCARLRPTIQAGGRAIGLARRCRGAPLAALAPGQKCGSIRLCVGHWLDAEPCKTDTSITLSLNRRGRLARSTCCSTPSRQREPLNFARQVITHKRRSSRFGWAQTASRLRKWMRWLIAPTNEFVGV
jgi:hypothetical protein